MICEVNNNKTFIWTVLPQYSLNSKMCQFDLYSNNISCKSDHLYLTSYCEMFGEKHHFYRVFDEKWQIRK